MRKTMSAVAFYLLCALMSPLILVGYVVWVGKIATTAPGSVVAFDYFTTEPLESRALYWRYGRATTKAVGEVLTFGVDSTPPSRERLSELLRSCGLSLAEQRTLGDDTPTRLAWGGFAIATVDER